MISMKLLLISIMFLCIPGALFAQGNIFNVYEQSGYINVGVSIEDRNDEVILIKDFYGYRNVMIDSIRMVHVYRRGGIVHGFQQGFGTGFIYGALIGAVGGLFLKNNQPGTTEVEFKVLAITGAAMAGSAALAVVGGLIGGLLEAGRSIDEVFDFSGLDYKGKTDLIDKFIDYQKTGSKNF